MNTPSGRKGNDMPNQSVNPGKTTPTSPARKHLSNNTNAIGSYPLFTARQQGLFRQGMTPVDDNEKDTAPNNDNTVHAAPTTILQSQGTPNKRKRSLSLGTTNKTSQVDHATASMARPARRPPHETRVQKLERQHADRAQQIVRLEEVVRSRNHDNEALRITNKALTEELDAYKAAFKEDSLVWNNRALKDQLEKLGAEKAGREAEIVGLEAKDEEHVEVIAGLRVQLEEARTDAMRLRDQVLEQESKRGD